MKPNTCKPALHRPSGVWRNGRASLSGVGGGGGIETTRVALLALMISPKDVDPAGGEIRARDGDRDAAGSRVAKPELFFICAGGFWKSWRTARNFSRRAEARRRFWRWADSPARRQCSRGKKPARRHFCTSRTRSRGEPTVFSRGLWTAHLWGFPKRRPGWIRRKTTVTGTPVRPQFHARDAGGMPPRALGLGSGSYSVILVVGGSQGASGLNNLVLSALPMLAKKNWQWLHLTGAADVEKSGRRTRRRGSKPAVKPFLMEMELALGAATALREPVRRFVAGGDRGHAFAIVAGAVSGGGGQSSVFERAGVHRERARQHCWNKRTRPRNRRRR